MLLNIETSSKSIKPQTGVRQYLLIGDIKENKLEETKIKIYNIQINRWRTTTVSDLFISYTLVINEFKSFNRIKIFIVQEDFKNSYCYWFTLDWFHFQEKYTLISGIT